MSWKLTGTPKTHKMTKTLAEKFAHMDPVPNDRPLSENRLRVYEKMIVAGEFRPCTWAAALCKETGVTYRVNGKHTSTIMSALDLDTVPELHAVVEYYECDRLDDVSKLYSTYDSKIQSRTARDINMSFAGCVPQLSQVDSRTISLSVGGIAFSQFLESYASKTTQQERAEALFDHWDFVVWTHKLVGSGNNNKTAHLKRMPVFAAMYATFNKAPLVASRFWQAVMEETGENPNLPDRKLARFLLLNSKLNSRGGRDVSRHRVKDKEFFIKSLHAWNAFRAGETTNLNYYQDAKIPAIS